MTESCSLNRSAGQMNLSTPHMDSDSFLGLRRVFQPDLLALLISLAKFLWNLNFPLILATPDYGFHSIMAIYLGGRL